MDARQRRRTAAQGIARARPLLAAACFALPALAAAAARVALGALAAAAAGVALAAAGAAADGAQPDAEAAALARALEASPPELAPGAVVVRLAFGAEADLDLYVTDPLEEAVYFGNTPARSGGRLLADRRCDTPAPRIETVVFEAAPPGRYRVGVDFPERCDGGLRGSAAFAVELWVGGRRELRAGRIAPGVFEPIVLEQTHAPE